MTPSWKDLEQKISALVKTERRPVAVAFLESLPAGVARFEGTEPSGCSFWRLAAAGKVFYTLPENHFNCAVGAYTHNIPLSPEREKETEQTLKMMFDLGYVKPEEVPTTFDQLVSVSQRLQKEGKVKWGYVGGMTMNNTWFSLWWTMWANNCDILKPLFERDNDKLAAAKFEPAATEPCHREIVEFWWDAINTHKISPPGMTA